MTEGNQEQQFSAQPALVGCEGRAETPDKMGGPGEQPQSAPPDPSLGAIQLCRGKREARSRAQAGGRDCHLKY